MKIPRTAARRLCLAAAAISVIATSLSLDAGTGSAVAAGSWKSLSGVSIVDQKGGSSMRCSSATVTMNPTNTGFNPVAQVTAISFVNCTSSVGTSVTVTAKGLSWPVSANPSARMIGETSGGHGISVAISSSGCTAVADGTGAGTDTGFVNFTFRRLGGPGIQLSGGNLHVYSPVGCSGFLSNGDSVTISGLFRLG
jgi:hypothetical protein